MGSCTPQPPKQKPFVETPLIESSILSRAAGCRIFLKLENLQPSASFKSRGIGYLIRHHVTVAQQSSTFNPDDLHFFISSGGNAGMACVTAANTFGIKSSVVIPSSTPQSMIIKLKAAGATEVLVAGDVWAHADQHLRTVVIPNAEKNGERAIYINPFDDPLLWDGYSTMISEIKKEMVDDSPPDAIVCSVGGGGLFCGIMQGLDQQGWSETTTVIACETSGADSLNQSLQAGQRITLPAITSFAKSLGASQVSQQTFDQGQRPNVHSLVLQDSEAAEACWRFADDERMLVEPACGVSVALAYRGRLKNLVKGFNKDSKVVIVVCGGSLVSLADLARWKETYGHELSAEGIEAEAKLVPSSVAT